MLFRKKILQSGFSVIELMVSASIIIVLSVMVVANFRGQTQKSALVNEAERLSSVLHQAHINALTGYLVDGSRPAGGFGVRITECASGCSYILFADKNANHIYDGEPADGLIQTLNMLEDNVYVDSLLPETTVDVVFVPPKGDIYINNNPSYDESITTLGFTNSDYSRNIIINRHFGKIDIE